MNEERGGTNDQSFIEARHVMNLSDSDNEIVGEQNRNEVNNINNVNVIYSNYEEEEMTVSGSEHEISIHGVDDGLDDDDDEADDEEDNFERPSLPLRNLGEILVNVIRQPFRLTRNFTLHYRSQPSSDEDFQANEHDNEFDTNFDTDLPAEHSYLQCPNMARVSGINFRDVGKLYRMLLFPHNTLLFPGETLPMMLPAYWLDPSLYEDEGIQFGLIFPFTMDANNIYGITCQIYESGEDERQMLLKARGNQRFVVSRKDNSNFDEIAPQSKSYAFIRILPEIYLPDPLQSGWQLGSMNRFRDLPSMEKKLRTFQAATTVWPSYVYEPYNVKKILEKSKSYLESYKIQSMPTDPILASFWLGRNLIFNTKERSEIFLTNSVNGRMQIIDKSLKSQEKFEKFFCCIRCESKIASCKSLFAMSKSGVQSNYINPGGCIHETNTVFQLVKDAASPMGQPSTEFSWFPGYSWQIISCRVCKQHLGWKFAATNEDLIPKQFYGLSGLNLKVLSSKEMKKPYPYLENT